MIEISDGFFSPILDSVLAWRWGLDDVQQVFQRDMEITASSEEPGR